MSPQTSITPESSVHERYSGAASARESELCCPTAYDPRYLNAIPREILERDYGCGDPTRHVRPGEVVLDLGSGGGKACYIAAQVVGPEGRVIGVDCNQEMLALARRHRQSVAERLGFANVEFRCGLIQDLRLDLDRLARELEQQPVRDQTGWLGLRAIEERLRRDQPLVADECLDCVISHCVLNLVQTPDRVQLFREIFRVLKRGGRVAVSDIVADEDVPEHLQRDPRLWSGCIAGAFREDSFLEALEGAGFHGLRIADRQSEPWRTVEGIEFRSLTVLAFKGKHGPCLERNQAVIYKGPFQKVEDDDGHVYRRGERMAVCDKTFHLLGREPYAGTFEPVEPRMGVPLESALPFDCRRSTRRHPRETKGAGHREATEVDGTCCKPDGPCC